MPHEVSALEVRALSGPGCYRGRAGQVRRGGAVVGIVERVRFEGVS